MNWRQFDIALVHGAAGAADFMSRARRVRGLTFREVATASGMEISQVQTHLGVRAPASPELRSYCRLASALAIDPVDVAAAFIRARDAPAVAVPADHHRPSGSIRPSMSRLGVAVRDARKAAGLSDAGHAAAAGISLRSLRALERGRTGTATMRMVTFATTIWPLAATAPEREAVVRAVVEAYTGAVMSGSGLRRASGLTDAAYERRAAALDLLRDEQVLRTLMQPTRLAMLRLVAAGSRSAATIAEDLGQRVAVVRLSGVWLARAALVNVPADPDALWRLHPATGTTQMEIVARAPAHLFALAAGGAGTRRLLMPGVLARPAAPRELAASLGLSLDAIARGTSSLLAAGAAEYDGEGRFAAATWLEDWLGELEKLAEARRAFGTSAHDV